MVKYRFSAAAVDGSVINGVEKSAGVNVLREMLLDRNLQPISIAEKKSIWQFEITQKKVKKRDLMHLCRQLAVFIRSGVSVIEALMVLSEEASSKILRTSLDEMRVSLEAGARFSEAAAEHSELWPGYTVEVLRSAELTGNLDEVMDQLADYLDREIETEHKVKSALAYPSIVMILAVIVTGVLVIYVLPKFKSFFKSLNAKLPLVTRILMAVANWMGHWGYVLGGVVVGLAILLYIALRTQRGVIIKDTVVLKIPVIGDLIHTSIIERFCRLLASMTIAGVALPEALAVTTASTANTVFRRGLTEARGAMLRGEGLAGPLSETGLFPGAARQMFAVGESTGSMDDQLQAAANYLDRELDYKLKRFTTLIEPAVIIFVGVIVGFVAVALISAMYGIFRQVKVT